MESPGDADDSRASTESGRHEVEPSRGDGVEMTTEADPWKGGPGGSEAIRVALSILTVVVLLGAIVGAIMARLVPEGWVHW